MSSSNFRRSSSGTLVRSRFSTESCRYSTSFSSFFFQAEDGIRYRNVTGVQTCALPIWRPGLLYANGAFHGLTCGALSLMGDPFWREGFGPLLPETEAIPFDDVDALERKLAKKRFEIGRASCRERV